MYSTVCTVQLCTVQYSDCTAMKEGRLEDVLVDWYRKESFVRWLILAHAHVFVSSNMQLKDRSIS